ncbi:MAG TPA: DsbA family protein [Candidatus Dormibacteraeota bacterium]|jgi:2-hydroxychromene-2-carboxylate isomerase
MDIDFWFDPACPFCWRTSRWLLGVAPLRNLTIRWRSISLLEKNGGAENVPEQYRAPVVATHRMLRVAERLRAEGRSDLIERFYTEVGTQIHHDGVDAQDIDVAAVLGALGADPSVAAALDDESLDDAIRASMSEALSRTGEDVGTPLVGIDGSVYFGPVVAPVPTGEEALELFDAWRTLVRLGTFWELKRGREGIDMTPPPRPETVVPSRQRVGSPDTR